MDGTGKSLLNNGIQIMKQIQMSLCVKMALGLGPNPILFRDGNH